MKETKTALYRHFDSSGKLLYVGISLSAVHRLSRHGSSPWYADIARVDIQHFETRADAMEAELIAIKTENPLFNKMHAAKPLSRLDQLLKDTYEWANDPNNENDEYDLVRFTDSKSFATFLSLYQKYARKRERRVAKA